MKNTEKIILTLEQCVDKYGPVKGPVKWQEQYPDGPEDIQIDYGFDLDDED
jgi:hypothetical protein